MATENSVLMKNARASLEGKWLLAIGTFFVAMIIMVVTESILVVIPFGGVAALLVSGPLAIGLAEFSLNISRGRKAELEQMFDGFKNFGTAFLAYLLMVIFVLLWTLLLIVPGIIAALSYAMTPYIIVENPDIQPMDAIDQSKAMMDGYKAKLFRLYLRFFGWALLCILTMGFGFFILIPYVNITMAKFYDDVRSDRGGDTALNDPHPSDGGGTPVEPVTANEPTVESSSEKQYSTGYTKEDEVKTQYNK